MTDHSQLTSTRRTIARVLTVMTERDLDESIVPRAAAPEPRKTAGRTRSRAAGTAASATKRTTRSTTTKSKEAATESVSGGNEE